MLLRRLLAGAIAGLVFLHEHDIGHNDFKPANILLFPRKPGTGHTAKLADLGLALGERAIVFFR